MTKKNVTPSASRRKKTSTSKPSRATPARLSNREPTSEELAHATRALHETLNRVVSGLNLLNQRGFSDAEAWNRTQFIQSPRVRHGVSRLSGVELAVRAFAERSIIEGKRKTLGRRLGELALALARGQHSPDIILRAARKIRKDNSKSSALGDGTHGELQRIITRTRTEPARWRAIYNVLAHESESWPVVDTARGRGPLQELYEWLNEHEAGADDVAPWAAWDDL